MDNGEVDSGGDRRDGNRSKGVCNKRARNPEWFYPDNTQDRQQFPSSL